MSDSADKRYNASQRKVYSRRSKTLLYFSGHWQFYLMLVPAIIYYAVFHYKPMTGLVIAFKDYNMFKGTWASPWSGLTTFRYIFNNPDFYRAIKNTLVLNVLNLILGFPMPILLALFLNELKTGVIKKITQTILYLPHFISWVIIGGMACQIFSTTTGIVNNALNAVFGITVPFLANPGWWVFTYFIISVWHSIGWSAIIYMSAITSIDQEIYEAAKVDGSTRFHTMFFITLPNIKSTIVIMLILQVGTMATIGFEQPLSLQNSAVMSTADVISTFVYRVGTQNAKYSVATGVGMFQSIINFILVVGTNTISNRLTGQGIW